MFSKIAKLPLPLNGLISINSANSGGICKIEKIGVSIIVNTAVSPLAFISSTATKIATKYGKIDTTKSMLWFAPLIKQLYEFTFFLIPYNNTKIIYQGEQDGYGKTLEEAIFYKLFNMSVFSKFTNNYVKSLKDNMKLNLVICNKEIIKSHELLESNINNKVNFILSLIFGDLINKAIPNYIDEGLRWLIKN